MIPNWSKSLLLTMFFVILVIPKISLSGAHNYASLVLREALAPLLLQTQMPACQENHAISSLTKWDNSLGNYNAVNYPIVSRLQYEWLQGNCQISQELLDALMKNDPYHGSVIAASLWMIDKEQVPLDLHVGISNYARNRGLLAYGERDFGASIRWFEAALHLASNREAATYLVGIYARSEDTGSMLATWELFKEGLTTNDADYWWAEAQIAELQKNWAQAIVAYQQFVRISGADYSVFMRLGEIHAQIGNVENAKAFYLRAIEERPNVMMPYLAVGHLAFGQVDYDQALVWYKQAELIEPYADEPKFFQARAYCELGSFSQAESYFDSAQIADPSDTALFFYWALCIEKQNDLPRASEVLQKAILLRVELGGAPVAWMILLGDWLNDQAKIEDALDAYHQALQWQPNSEFIKKRIQGTNPD